MRAFLDAVRRHAERAPDRPAYRDSRNELTRSVALAEAGRLAARLPRAARTIGLLLPDGCEWAVAQLACIAAGRRIVPLPPFFSADQSAHVLRDAGLPNATPLDELKRLLNPTNVPEFEAVAVTGQGVFDTLKAVAKLVLQELRKGR
jgi:acyl-CoA synthetase (AMP-forming)/AMP-acid ligase II